MGRFCASSGPACPVDRAISVLQEKWVLSIVHTLLDGPRGFNELGREAGGCNPTTLTQRLARLEEFGLVTRTCEQERGGRSGYALTQAGEALSDVIEAIHAWSLLHLHVAENAVPAASPLHADAANAALGNGSLGNGSLGNGSLGNGSLDGGPLGDERSGDRSAGGRRTDGRRAGGRRARDDKAGDDRAGDHRTGDSGAGDGRTGDRSAGDGRADLVDDVVVEPISAGGSLT